MVKKFKGATERIAELEADLAAAKRQIEADRRDTERLDWLDSYLKDAFGEPMDSVVMDIANLCVLGGNSNEYWDDDEAYVEPDIRAAIDAAMEERDAS